MVLDSLNQYGNSFQIKVLSSLLKNKEFLQNINDILEIEMFDSPSTKWIVDEVLKYYKKYHTNPSLDYLQVEVKKIDNEVLKVAVIEQLKESLKASVEDRDYVENEFSNFCKNQQLKKAILSSVDLLQKGLWDDIRPLIDKALKAGQDKRMGHEYEKDIETRFREDSRHTVATPWAHINDLMMGGLGAGDLGLIFAGPGVGKSWFLASIGAMAITLGYNVVHYTLELSEEYTAKRYDSILTKINFKDLGEHKKEIEEAVSKVKGKLVIKYYPMKKASVSTIETHIQKLRNLDTPPDLVLIDYVDLLKSKSRYNDPKNDLDDVYMAVKGLAGELKLPIWSVSQLNRCHNINDLVDTPSGKIKIGQLKKNDLVLTHMGYKKVINVYEIEKQPTYKIKLKNGKEVNVSADHFLPTTYNKLKSISTGLKVGDKLFTKK